MDPTFCSSHSSIFEMLPHFTHFKVLHFAHFVPYLPSILNHSPIYKPSMIGLLSPQEVLQYRLEFSGHHGKKSNNKFKKHFGSSLLDLAKMWYNLTTTDIPKAKLNDKKHSMVVLKRFFMAHFLWLIFRNPTYLHHIFMFLWVLCPRKASLALDQEDPSFEVQ